MGRTRHWVHAFLRTPIEECTLLHLAGLSCGHSPGTLDGSHCCRGKAPSQPPSLVNFQTRSPPDRAGLPPRGGLESFNIQYCFKCLERCVPFPKTEQAALRSQEPPLEIPHVEESLVVQEYHAQQGVNMAEPDSSTVQQHQSHLKEDTCLSTER